MLLERTKQGWLRKCLNVSQKIEEKFKVQIEMAGRCREWFKRAVSDEMETNGKLA
jgi:hypothetical protein